MDIRQLRYFYTICEEGQITAAAKKLHMAQPPLSQSLQQLEKELGVSLIKRGTRNIQLTDAGVLLKERAEVILRMCETTKIELLDGGKQLHRKLSIGIVTSSHNVFLNNGLQSFHKQFPYVTYQLKEGNTFQVLDMLEKGIVEIGIIRTPFVSKHLCIKTLQKEAMVAVFSKTKHVQSDKGIDMIELGSYPLVYYERYASIIQELFLEYGVSPNVVCMNQDARTTLLWANAGLGVGIVPKSAVTLIDNRNLYVREIQEERLQTSISMIYRNDRYISDTAMALLNCYETK